MKNNDKEKKVENKSCVSCVLSKVEEAVLHIGRY